MLHYVIAERLQKREVRERIGSRGLVEASAQVILTGASPRWQVLSLMKEDDMAEPTYNIIVPEKGAPIKAWTKGVQLEDQARQQLLNVAQLPF